MYGSYSMEPFQWGFDMTKLCFPGFWNPDDDYVCRIVEIFRVPGQLASQRRVLVMKNKAVCTRQQSRAGALNIVKNTQKMVRERATLIFAEK